MSTKFISIVLALIPIVFGTLIGASVYMITKSALLTAVVIGISTGVSLARINNYLGPTQRVIKTQPEDQTLSHKPATDSDNNTP